MLSIFLPYVQEVVFFREVQHYHLCIPELPILVNKLIWKIQIFFKKASHLSCTVNFKSSISDSLIYLPNFGISLEIFHRFGMISATEMPGQVLAKSTMTWTRSTNDRSSIDLNESMPLQNLSIAPYLVEVDLLLLIKNL